MIHIRETVSVAIDALRANKLRAMLTSLGVIIGSASIVLVVTVALTSKKFVISQIESVGVNLVGVTEGYQAIRRLVILRGRYFDAADMQMRSKVSLITTQLADKIFGQENPVGRSMRMGELMFTVIGVFRERVETFGLSDIQENSVLIPFSLMKYYTGIEVVRLLDVQAARAEDVPSVERQLGQLLRSRHPAE